MSTDSYLISNKRKSQKASFSFKAIPVTPVFHWIIWLACIVFLAIYLWGIASALNNGVNVESASERLSSLKNEMTTLEFSYMSLANNVDLREAYSRGFVDSVNPSFVQTGSAPSLSLSR